MKVTWRRSTTRFRVALAGPKSCALEPDHVRERHLADDADRDRARAERFAGISARAQLQPHAVARATFDAPAAAHWSTRYSPQPPGPSGVSIGRSGSSKPGPSSTTLRCTTSPRAAPRPRPVPPPRRVADRRWRPARWPAAAGPSRCARQARARSGRARPRARARLSGVAAKRSETRLGGVTRSARQAMSSRGLPPALLTAVRSRCSTTARGPSAAFSATSAARSCSVRMRRGASASLTPSV